MPSPAHHETVATQCARDWLDQARTGLMVVQHKIICFANQAMEELMGAAPGSLVGRVGLSLVTPEYRQRVHDQVRQRLKGESDTPYDIRCSRDDGTSFDARVCGRRIDLDGAPADLVTIVDITALKNAWRDAQWNAGMLAHAESLCRFGSFDIELPSGAMVLSGGLRELVGMPPDAPDRAQIDKLDWLLPDEHDQVVSRWRSATVGEPFELQHRVATRDGRRLVVLHRGVVTASPVTGQLRGVAILQDVTAQRDAERRVLELAKHDELTGLPNRASFLDRVDIAIHAGPRELPRFAVLALDIPRIAELKSTLGFGAGDALIMAMAARLSMCCSERDSVAHLGGGEFAMLLADEAAQDSVLQRAKDLQAVIQAPQRIADTDVLPTCIIGIADYPGDGGTAPLLLKCAQTARSAARSNAGIAFFEPRANAHAMRELQLESALRRAIEHNELTLDYQAQTDLNSGAIVGAEALLRWTSAEHGVVPPIEVVRAAERAAQTSALGRWGIREVCRQIAAWRRAGLPAMCISLNVSATLLAQGEVAQFIRDALNESGADAACLGIELIESALLPDLERVPELLRDIKATGVQIAIDNFGTGISSLSSLRRLPIDVVKIDRTFVHDVSAAPAEVSVTRAIITMAHSMQVRVLATGVESEGQASLLAANGCDLIQGYWFSPPVPPAEFEAMLTAGRRLPEQFTTRFKRKRTLLVVDDEDNIVSSLKRLFRRDGYHIVTAHSAAEGLQKLAETQVDVILSDQRMPGMTGVEFLRRAKELYPDTVRMVLSGFTELQSIIDAVNEGAIYKFLTKPWDDERLREHVEEAFRHKEMADENRRLARQVESANTDLATLNERLERLLAQQRQQAELLSASAGGMREMLDELPAAVVGIDADGMVAYVNRQAEAVLPGASALLGRMAMQALPIGLRELAGRDHSGQRTLLLGTQQFNVLTRVLASGSTHRGRLLMLLPQSNTEIVYP